MATGSDVLVKGTPLRTVSAFMTAQLGAAGREKALDQAALTYPDEVRRLRERDVMATERFPVAFVNHLVELTAEQMRVPPIDLAHRVGRRGAEEAASGIMRMAMMFISIPNLLRKLAPVWSTLYSHGKMDFRSEGHSATIELTEFPFVSATNCSRISGWFEWFSQQAEKTAVIRHVACRARGDELCRWDLRW